MTTTTCVWFRKALRLRDNAPITACVADKSVLPLFVLDPAWATPAVAGSNRCRFLLEALADLDAQLRARGAARRAKSAGPIVAPTGRSVIISPEATTAGRTPPRVEIFSVDARPFCRADKSADFFIRADDVQHDRTHT